MKIFVGTSNILKKKSVKAVFNEFYPNEKISTFSINVASEIPSQPIGIKQVIEGAKNRAKNVYKLYLESKMCNEKDRSENLFFVGIEAGLVKIPDSITGFLDFQFCAILHKNKFSIGSGPGWEYPPEVINKILDDRNLEISDLMRKISKDEEIKYTTGAIGYYSNGRVNRYQITKIAIKMALIPILNEKKYFSS